MGANGIGRGGCPSLAPIPRARWPPASRIRGGGPTAVMGGRGEGVKGTLRKEGDADPLPLLDNLTLESEMLWAAAQLGSCVIRS